MKDGNEEVSMNEINTLWFEYNAAKNRIQEALGRTANILGEYAEALVAEAYHGEVLPTAHKSADVLLPDGRTIQVKARTIKAGESSLLSAMRSWDFDLLVVLLFDETGKLLWAGELTAEAAQGISRFQKHTNSYQIWTNSKLFDESVSKDVRSMFPKELLADS